MSVPHEQEQQTNDLLGTKKVIVSILSYDTKEHNMEYGLRIHHRCHDDNDNDNNTDDNESPQANQEQDSQDEKWEWFIDPSDEWMGDYQNWKRPFSSNGGDCGVGNADVSSPPPVFDDISSLRTFNAKGIELTERLQAEVDSNAAGTLFDDANNNNDVQNNKRNTTEVVVEPFKPIYSNVAVGDAVCSWWHVKDMNYDFIIPIQKLPISDELKSQFQAWRFHKLRGWLDPDIRCELNMERQKLENKLKYELNDAPAPPPVGAPPLEDENRNNTNERLVGNDKEGTTTCGTDAAGVLQEVQSPTCVVTHIMPNNYMKLDKVKDNNNTVERWLTPCLS